MLGYGPDGDGLSGSRDIGAGEKSISFGNSGCYNFETEGVKCWRKCWWVMFKWEMFR